MSIHNHVKMEIYTAMKTTVVVGTVKSNYAVKHNSWKAVCEYLITFPANNFEVLN